MKILHIASIKNDKFNGICVAVPKHIEAQSKLAEVLFMNVNNIKIDNIVKQIAYNKNFIVSEELKNIDCVVFHECYIIEYISIAKKLNKIGIPYIIVPHGELRLEALKKKRLKKAVANLLIFNNFVKKSSGIQCLSQAELNNTKVKKNKFIGTNGIDIPKVQKESFNKDRLNFVYIGRYEWRVKGIDLMIDAVKKVENIMRDNNCTIEMYGPDFYSRMAAVQSMIDENNIGDIIKIYHEISGKEKEKKLLDADIFIQTSRHEGMPMGILEALSYGIPCLVTEGTTLGEKIRDYNAGFVANTDSESISKAILRSISSKFELKQKSLNAIRLIKDNFEWGKISNKTIQNYKELI